MNENFYKTMDGTGAPIVINCGFIPAYVKVVNVESATVEQIEWFRGMADGHGIKATVAAPRTKIVANGITINGDAVTDTTEQGFTIGVDADVNVAGETIVIVAERGGAGNQF